MLFREGKADRESQRQIFLFAAEKTDVLRPLWLVGGQVPGSIFPYGKNLHPAAKAATLTAPILPVPTATPKTEADSRASQPPFPSCQYTGRIAAATWWQTVGFMQGVPPAPPPHPKADRRLRRGRAGAFWLYHVITVRANKSAVLWVKYICSVILPHKDKL